MASTLPEDPVLVRNVGFASTTSLVFKTADVLQPDARALFVSVVSLSLPP